MNRVDVGKLIVREHSFHVLGAKRFLQDAGRLLQQRLRLRRFALHAIESARVAQQRAQFGMFRRKCFGRQGHGLLEPMPGLRAPARFPQQPRQVVHRDYDVRMLRRQRLLFDRQRPPQQRIGFLEAALQQVHFRQIVHGGGGARVLRPQQFFLNLQRSPEQGLGFLIPALHCVQRCQVIHGGGAARFALSGLFAGRQDAPVKPLGLVQTSLPAI